MKILFIQRGTSNNNNNNNKNAVRKIEGKKEWKNFFDVQTVFARVSFLF